MYFNDWLNSAYGFGSAMPLLPKTIDAAPDQVQAESPAQGESTGTQLTAATLTASATMGFLPIGGFGQPWPACFGTWGRMLNNPTLALVRRIVFASILAGQWTVEADEDAPEGAKELLEKSIVKHRVDLIEYGLTALDYKCAPFEVVWDYDPETGKLIILKFKPLARVLSTILTFKNGGFAGIEQGVAPGSSATAGTTATATDGGRVQLLGPKAWMFVNEPTPDHPFGQSRLENVRHECFRWHETQERIDRLTNKETGSAVHVTHPPGNTADGKAMGEVAKTHAENTAAGVAYFATENALGALTPQQRNAATPEQIAELLKLDLWKTENIEIGGNAEAIAALEERIAALDAKISRGYYRPERSSQEGQHGTKAEAGTHTDTGTLDSETVEGAFVRQLNKGPVNDLLRLNYGDAAVDKARIVAHPLRDVQEEIDRLVIEKVSSSPTTADEFYRTFDIEAICERRGIPKREEPLPTPVAVAQGAQPGDGNVPVKVNGAPASGRMNGNGDLKMSRDDGAHAVFSAMLSKLAREAEDAEGL